MSSNNVTSCIGYPYLCLSVLTTVVIALVNWAPYIIRLCKRQKCKKRDISDDANNTIEKCPFCIEKIEDLVEIRCGHAFCAKCMADFWLSRHGSLLKCPVCKKEFSFILSNNDSGSSKLAADHIKTINDYNAFAADNQKRFLPILRDFPLLLTEYSRICSSEAVRDYSMEIIGLLVLVAIYIICPWNLRNFLPKCGFIVDVLITPILVYAIGKIMVGRIL